MRLLMIPYDSTNPYQQQIGRGLASCGITVSYSAWRWLLPLTGPEAPDVLHIHWLRRAKASPAKFAAALLSFYFQILRFRRRGGVLIWTVHNLSHHEGLYARREQWLGTIIGRLADIVIVHSQSAVEPVIEKFAVRRDKLLVTPHPSYAAGGRVHAREEARIRLGLPTGKTVFAFVGSVRPYKGVEELLAAHAQLENSDTHLIVAGRPLSADYESRIVDFAKRAPGVTLMLRHLEDEEMELVLAAADAVVLPYRAILTSGALVLAMGMGRACIAPRMGVFEEHLAGGGGILYNPGSIEGLVDALRQASERPGLLEEFGERNRTLVAHWGPEAVGEQMAAAIQNARPARK